MPTRATPAATPAPKKRVANAITTSATKSARGVARPVPAKLWPKFPLSWHKARGYWFKKREGKQIIYEANAIKSYDRYKEDLKKWERGEVADSSVAKGLTVRDAMNVFLTAKHEQLDDGKIGDVQFAKY